MVMFAYKTKSRLSFRSSPYLKIASEKENLTIAKVFYELRL